MAYRTMVVGLLPQHIATLFAEVRTLLRARFTNLALQPSEIPPHVTILEPVQDILDAEDIERIDGRPRNIRICIRGYGRRTTRAGSAIYVTCESPYNLPSEAIMTARQDILGMFPPLVSLVTAVPTFHITVAQPVPHALVVTVQDFLTNHFRPEGLAFTIEHLAIFQRETIASPWTPAPMTAKLLSSSS